MPLHYDGEPNDDGFDTSLTEAIADMFARADEDERAEFMARIEDRFASARAELEAQHRDCPCSDGEAMMVEIMKRRAARWN